MPLKIVYVGPLRSPNDERGDIEIAATEQWARAGEPIEVETELAEQLLEQEGNWARPNTKAAGAVKRPRRRRPAAAVTQTDPEQSGEPEEK